MLFLCVVVCLFCWWIFCINFTISYHNTDAAAKPKTVKICIADRGASFRNSFRGVYKIRNSPNRVKMFTAHMILSLDKRLIEVMILSLSELLT